MRAKNLYDRIGTFALLTFAIVISVMQVRNEEPLLHYLIYSYDTVFAKVIDFKNQDASGYFSSKAVIAYEYEGKKHSSNIELMGITLDDKEDSIEIYISKKNNNILTTKSNLQYSAGSIILTLFLGVFWLFSFINLVRITCDHRSRILW